jgi:acetyl-CoA acetyltransferase family protein
MQRVAIVEGCRTPFVRAGGKFAEASFLDLGVHTLKSLVERMALDPRSIDEFVFGTVLLDPRAPNYAREVVLRSGLPETISAHAVSNNCISGLVALSMLTDGIRCERIKVGIGGGSESMSRPTLTLHPKAERLFLALSRARTVGERLKLVARYRPKFALPIPPSPKEPSTGLTMGQHCEITTQELGIKREVQDQIAFRSHQRAAAAQKSGYLAAEIAPYAGVEHDNLVRADTSLEKLAKLAPVFDRSGKGTLTAGNSSALTDGASLVCLMSESEARRQGRDILGFIEGIHFAAIAPRDGLLMAPTVALPELLARHNLTVDQIDRFEIHEAFGAQVAANLEVWERGWSKYAGARVIGAIPEEKINVNGGSIAIGHPFAATGGRLVLSLARELKRTNLNTGVISVCAAGAMAGAVLIRRA